MLRLIGIFCIASLLSSCAYFNNNYCCNKYARCKEAKRQLMFLNATNDELVQTQRNAEIDNLNHTCRNGGCY